MLRENKTMTILDMQHLKMLEVGEVVLVILISQVIFQISLKIFLEKDLVEEEEDQESQAIEDQI